MESLPGSESFILQRHLNPCTSSCFAYWHRWDGKCVLHEVQHLEPSSSAINVVHYDSAIHLYRFTLCIPPGLFNPGSSACGVDLLSFSNSILVSDIHLPQYPRKVGPLALNRAAWNANHMCRKRVSSSSQSRRLINHQRRPSRHCPVSPAMTCGSPTASDDSTSREP